LHARRVCRPVAGTTGLLPGKATFALFALLSTACAPSKPPVVDPPVSRGAHDERIAELRERVTTSAAMYGPARTAVSVTEVSMA
jgi:hypothetical protein